MKIYLVRHGETECNEKGVYYGFTDVALNENGIRQAQKVGEQLMNLSFDKIYISDMKRSSQTAEIILEKNISAKALSPQKKIYEGIKEINFGLWEEHTYKEIMKEWPSEYDLWANDWLHIAPPEGEAYVDFFDRCQNAFQEIIEDAKQDVGENAQILIVAHNGSLRGILAVMLGLGAEGTWHFNFEQDAYSLIDFEYENYTVRKVNCNEKIK